MSSALALEKTLSYRLPGSGSHIYPSGCHTPVRFQPSVCRAKNNRGGFYGSPKRPRRLRGCACREFDRRRGHAYAGHVCGQRIKDRLPNHFADPILPRRQWRRVKTHQASPHSSPGARPMPSLGAAKSARRGNPRGLFQCPFRRIGFARQGSRAP